MESERGIERVGCVTSLRHAQVIPKKFLIFGIDTVFNDCLCLLDRRLASEVGDALIGYEHIDRVSAVVEVRHPSARLLR